MGEDRRSHQASVPSKRVRREVKVRIRRIATILVMRSNGENIQGTYNVLHIGKEWYLGHRIWV